MKLILHIGTGKTGTSSIQKTLRMNETVLNKIKTKYLGFIFEFAYDQIYEWQKPSALSYFNHQLSSDKKQEELYDILDITIVNASKKGVEKLLLVNESLFSSFDDFIPVLHKLKRENKIDLNIVIYVRDYLSWSQSAYKQWAIKHKANSGKIKNYNEWAKDRISMFHFHKTIEPIIKEFPLDVTLKKMEDTKDVVKDFLHLCDIENKNFNIIRDNETPGNEDLLLRALFNNKFQGSVKPKVFNEIISSNIEKSITIEDYMDNLLPNNKDLSNLSNLVQPDMEELNKLLVNQGKKPYVKDNFGAKKKNVDTSKLLMMLSSLVMSQSIKIDKLEKQLKEIKSDD